MPLESNQESRWKKRTAALFRMLHRALSIARKELLHIVRDKRTLFMVFVSPAFTLMMLSYLFTWDVENFTLGIFDQDNSSLSRRYISSLTEDGFFDARERVQSYAEADQLLLRGRVQGVLVIPPSLMERVSRGESAEVQVILDGTNPSAARQMLRLLEGQTAAIAGRLSAQGEELERQLTPVEVRTRVWYNPNLKSLQSMVPGLIGVVMLMPAFSVATSLTREKEMGTLEGLLATPVRGTEVVLGKLAAYLGCGLMSVVPVIMVATLWFGIPFRGSILLYVALTADFLLAAICLSLLLANFLSSQQAAMVVLFLLLFIPSIFLSGLIDPVDRTSIIARLMANVLPTTHYVVISRGVFLKGVGCEALWLSAALLAGMGLGSLLLGARFFKEKLG
jgi:ABC-2 type transport system permease protein